MMIQLLLIAGLCACILYILAQKHRPKLISRAIIAISLCAIVLVLFPDLSTLVAERVGVGRGSDLVIYFWIVISFALIINLQLKILNLHRELTEVARQHAIGSAQPPRR